jgi:hypothetical protein
MKLIEILDSPIAFHRCLAEITGSANAGLLLSQAIYWQNRPAREGPNGWWYKTREDWYKETSLSRKELETARRACAGILLHKVKGIPPKTYYKVDVEELEKRLLALPSRSGPFIRPESDLFIRPETDRMNGPNGAEHLAHIGPSISTETNTETKAETNKHTQGRGSIEEVIKFCRDIGLPESDASWFFYKCEGNGWINGGKPIKNWRATIRAWQSAGYMPSQKQRNGQFSKPKEGASQMVERMLKGIQ